MAVDSRLTVCINYVAKIVYNRLIGTHAENDKKLTNTKTQKAIAESVFRAHARCHQWLSKQDVKHP